MINNLTDVSDGLADCENRKPITRFYRGENAKVLHSIIKSLLSDNRDCRISKPTEVNRYGRTPLWA